MQVSSETFCGILMFDLVLLGERTEWHVIQSGENDRGVLVSVIVMAHHPLQYNESGRIVASKQEQSG